MGRLDKKHYLEYLEGLTRIQLQDYLDQIWRGEVVLNEAEKKWLEVHLRNLKANKLPVYLIIFAYLNTLAKVTLEAQGRNEARPDDEKKEVTPAQIAGAETIITLFGLIEVPQIPEGYDYIWITRLDELVCKICKPLHGMYIADIVHITTHPGCRCEIVEVARNRTMDKLLLREAGAVRAVQTGKKRILEVLAAPFGSQRRKDRLGQYLAPDTDYMIEVGDKRPLLYYHGYSPHGRKMKHPPSIGRATVTTIDEMGLWMRAELNNHELANRTWEAALRGEARASTGSVNYLADHDPDTGKVITWAIAELSVFDGGDDRIPVSDDAVVIPLRALYKDQDIPYTFQAGKDTKAGVIRSQKLDNKDDIEMDANEIQKMILETMAAQEAAKADKEAEKEALRAEVKAELEAQYPKNYRETFNIGGKVTGRNSPYSFRKLMRNEEAEQYDKGEIEEADRFLFHMMKPLQAPSAMRVLEETEAAEGASLIPTPLLNRIVALRDEVSLVPKIGIQKMYTNSLTLVVPREDSGMGVFATIAEEGAYVANEPAFSGETVTVVKKGSMITATEELLEDSSIFEPYFVNLCGRKWGLTENLILFTELKADDTAGTHSATFTQAEIDAFMFQITDPWSDGAHFICALATMATIRGLLVATPRAYGDFPNFGGLKYPSLFGFPAHTNSNWEAVGGGDTTLTATLVNGGGMSWVERRGLSIKVDPYGDALNGRVRYFPSFRAACATTQVLCNVSYTDHA